MRAPTGFAVVAWLVMGSLPAAAYAQEWEEIPETKAKIVFYADVMGLAKDVGLTNDGETANDTYELGFWSSSDQIFGIYYASTGGKWVWRRSEAKINEKNLKTSDFLREKELSFGRDGNRKLMCSEGLPSVPIRFTPTPTRARMGANRI